ncbi:DUF6461 domain-containing protein [Streptomyces longisporoflavus]|uniref:DUF6461 domain-containing protein n=1 Tax=Streptomyces longisporoflavus TaxID=28044 RepID=A0ABW7QIK6_9ACTN
MSSDAWNWVAEPRYASFCLVFARTKTADNVLEVYGADPEAAVHMTLKESLAAFPYQDVEVLLRVGHLGDWTFCYEDRRLLGNTGEVRTALSWGCETISLHKGGDGTKYFERMEDCRRLELFEPRRPSDVRGEGPFVFSALVHDKLSAAGPNTLGMSALTMVLTERLGLELDRATLDGPLLTAPLRGP